MFGLVKASYGVSQSIDQLMGHGRMLRYGRQENYCPTAKRPDANLWEGEFRVSRRKEEEVVMMMMMMGSDQIMNNIE